MSEEAKKAYINWFRKVFGEPEADEERVFMPGIEEDSREAFIGGYTQGRADAWRWRKYPEEKPESTSEYIVEIDDNDDCGPYITSHLYSIDYGWSVQIGQSILRWLPLPEGER